MARGRRRKNCMIANQTKDAEKLQKSIVSARDPENLLEIQSRKILNTVTIARQPGQQLLRKQIQDLRRELEDGRPSRETPLQLFPQEIWLTIFDNLKVTDLANCTKTHFLFKMIIFSTDQQLLFGKVLPILFPYLVETGSQEQNYPQSGLEIVVSCGYVCKKWRAAVDCFADSYFCVNRPTYSGLQKLLKEPLPNFDDKDLLYQPNRYVMFGELRPVEVTDDRDLKLKIGMNPFLIYGFIRLFNIAYSDALSRLRWNDFWKLDIHVERKRTYTTRYVYFLCAKALQKSPKLKHLRLVNSAWACPNQEIQDNGLGNEIYHKQLECLEVTFKTRDILPVQDSFLLSLSSQLKRVQVHHWTNLCHVLNWNNLAQLEILEGRSSEVLESVALMRAPQLYKLHIRLDLSCQDFSAFFKCINTFPNLQHLSILVTDKFSKNLRHKVLDVPLDLLTSNRIITLEVFCRNLKKAQELPVLFPLVRNLVYHYGNRSNELKSCFADNAEFGSLKVKDTQIYYNTCNIWSLLPRLETLELDHNEGFEIINGEHHHENKIKATRKFTRFGYMTEADKYKRDIEVQLKKVREIASRQLREGFKTFGKIKKVPKSKLHEQVFALILPKLSEEDMLSCRLVCTAWCKVVGDLIFEGSANNIVYKFDISKKPKLISHIKKNKATPFFARNLQLRIQQNDENIEGIGLLLSILSERVHHLSLVAKENVVQTLADVYEICIECLIYCPNLRSCSVNIPVVTNLEQHAYQQLMTTHPILKPRHLEHLSFSGPVDSYETLTILMKNLEMAFCFQLKSLTEPHIRLQGDTFLWWVLDHHFTNIKEYTITNFDPERTNNYCWKTPTRNSETLEKLSLCINVPGMTIGHFEGIARVWPNPKFLNLQFGSEFFGLNKNAVDLDPNIVVPVSEIQIKLVDKYQVSLDFLIHFPFLKKVCIMNGEKESSDVERNAQLRSNTLNELPVRWLERDFIQLMKYLKDENKNQHDVQNIYSSNIWNLLQTLQTIEIVYFGDGNNKEIETFNRK